MARRTKRQIAEDNLAIAQAQAALMELQGTLVESHGAIVPRDDYPQFDVWDWQGSQHQIHTTTIEDRQDGKWVPFYETEDELRRMRAASRNLATFTSTALGAAESLANYTIGEGFDFTAQDNKGTAGDTDPKLIAAVQAVIDRFVKDNGFAESHVSTRLDREIHDRSREDGEILIELIPADGYAQAEIHEPDYLTAPANARQLDEWLADSGAWDGSYVPSWSFGVHSPLDRPSRPVGYHLVFNSQGSDWRYVPASRMVHLKRNVGRNAKRGVSDYFPVLKDLERESKLRSHTAEGAAIQAAIAFIREWPPGATKSSATAVTAGNARTDYDQTRKSGTVNVKVEKFRPGTVKDVMNGAKYHPGPMGSSNAPTYIEVVQMISRSIGIRWNMPEYLISGDASNANYSSTLVSENPFVRARISDQGFYKRGFSALIWKAVRISWESGVFDQFGIGWEQLQALVSIKAEAPQIESTDEAVQTAKNETLARNKILSRRTWAAQAGLDYDEEQENIAQEPQIETDFSGVAAVGAAMESVRTTSEARDILKQLELY